ncbi:MAG: dihydroorotase [Alphaproteobacteria bacterium]|nr:dihydroorotase [Alphaproteobacteria bacterium]
MPRYIMAKQIFTMPKASADPKRKVAYINARLLDPATKLDKKGALLTIGDTIADVGPKLFNDGVPKGIEVVDCKGQCLAPGLIDMHVHFRVPGQEYKETLESGSKSAAAGGITTVACMPNTDPVIDEPSLVEYIHRRASEMSYINIRTFGAITKGQKGEELSEMGLMAEAGAVGFSDDGRPVMHPLVMRRAMEYASQFGLIVSQHCEDLNLSGNGSMNEGKTATILGIPGIPNAAETIMVERDIRLLEITGGHYHVAHISAAEAVDAVRKAKKRGLNITCEATPHHFTLADDAVEGYRTFAKMSPPLRSQLDKQAVIDGLKDGTIDAIATDHAPHDPESKRVPFCCAANGIVGLETALPLSLALYHSGKLSLLEVIRALTLRPAELMRLPAGRLKKGAPADLTLFDPTRKWNIDIKAFHSKQHNSPLDGHAVKGIALRTVVKGQTVFELRG